MIPDGVDQATAITAVAWEITKESMNYKAMKVISNPEGNISLVRPQVSSVVIPMFKDTLSHYLVGYYTTHQPDGVQLSAHCTHQSGFDLAVRLIPN